MLPLREVREMADKLIIVFKPSSDEKESAITVSWLRGEL